MGGKYSVKMSKQYLHIIIIYKKTSIHLEPNQIEHLESHHGCLNTLCPTEFDSVGSWNPRQQDMSIKVFMVVGRMICVVNWAF